MMLFFMPMCTGILLIIGLGVALGVAFGVVLLSGLLYCFRRYSFADIRNAELSVYNRGIFVYLVS